MTVNDSLHGCQANPGAREIGCFVQPLERAEESSGVAGLKANAIVLHVVSCLSVVASHAKDDASRRARPGEFHGVVEQIGEHYFEQSCIAQGYQPGLDYKIDGPVRMGLQYC